MHSIFIADKPLWDQVAWARNPFTRLKGLLGRRSLAPGEGLLLSPCSQVHTLHMRFTLDVVHLDRQMRVLRVVTLPPNRVGPRVTGTVNVLEVAAGEAALRGVTEGAALTIR